MKNIRIKRKAICKRKSSSFITAALILLVLLPGCISLRGGDVVTVPVIFNGASQVGSIHFEIIYDRDVLDILRVETGQNAVNSLLSYNVNNPGQIVIGMANKSGITGDGLILNITYKIKGKLDKGTDLKLSNIFVFDSLTLDEIYVIASKGNIKSKTSFTGIVMEVVKP
jgi:hypothetical protein